jgi:hypothetical protein
VARRIELPSAEALFGENAAAKTVSSAGTRKKTAAPAKSSRASGAGAAKKPGRAPNRATSTGSAARPSRKSTTRAPRKSTPRRTPLARLETIETRLSELPVDALIDLRDGLEELLAADSVDETAVRRLLDTVEI